MQLIYHGQRFEYAATAQCGIFTTRACNWRYQVSGLNDLSQWCLSERWPAAINWRFQTVVNL
jgi:hypothetical protein